MFKKNNIEENLKEWYEKISPIEFSEQDNLDLLFIEKTLGYSGRMISASKSRYKGNAIFNANLCTDKRKLWYGQSG